MLLAVPGVEGYLLAGPAIVPALVAAASAAGGAALAGAVTSVIIGSAILAFASTLVMGLLAPKPPSGGGGGFGSFAAESGRRTSQVRQPITSWKWVIGDIRVSGALTLIESTGDNEFLHTVITVACHPCKAWKTCYLNDYPIYPEQLDGNGLVTEGRYANKVKIQVDLGTSGSQPFPDLSSAATGWKSTSRQDGHTKAYIRYEYDRDVFPSGIPDPAFRLTGRSDILDTRDASTGYSCNPALVIRKYMATSALLTGMGVSSDEIDDDETDASANVCDEIVATKSVTHTVSSVTAGSGSPIDGGYFDLNGTVCTFFTGDRVTLSGSNPPGGITAATNYYVIVDREQSTDEANLRVRLAASLDDAFAGDGIALSSVGSGAMSITKNGEPRYTAHGVIDTARTPAAILEDLRSAMAGFIPNSGGKWTIRAGYWETPTITLDEGDLAGPISMRTKQPRRDRFNAVKGVFASPLNFGQPQDYPVVTNTAYQTADGGDRVFNELDLPFTNRPQTAQRIATIQLERARREIDCTLQVNLVGLALRATDTVKISLARYGWVEKTFRVYGWRFADVGSVGSEEDSAPKLGVEIDLREEDSTVYDFDHTSQETIVTPATRSNLPNAFNVTVPTMGTPLSGTAQLFIKADGTVVSRIKVTWSTITDQFVLQNGSVEVRFRKTGEGESDWQVRRRIDPAVTFVYLEPVEDDSQYDIQIRAVNSLGVSSAWSDTVTHTVVGKTAPPSTVTGFSVQQNGSACVFKWQAISDADRAGYEIRYGPVGSYVYADATPVSDELIARGTTISTFLVPPGNWRFGIRAVDTSGNVSASAATYDLEVVNSNDIVFSQDEGSLWAGTLSGLVRHWTGPLMIDSTELANARDNDDVFDNYVVAPVSSASYTTEEIDLGFDAQGVRVYADSLSVLGPGETEGVADGALSIDYRLAGDSYPGFSSWTVGTAALRYMKARITFDPAKGLSVLRQFTPVCDVSERTESRGSLAVPDTGLVVTFDQRFHLVPHVAPTADGTDRIAYKTGVSETGYTHWIYDATTGLAVAGTGGYDATGV
jgi:hypothetical protein